MKRKIVIVVCCIFLISGISMNSVMAGSPSAEITSGTAGVDTSDDGQNIVCASFEFNVYNAKGHVIQAEEYPIYADDGTRIPNMRGDSYANDDGEIYSTASDTPDSNGTSYTPKLCVYSDDLPITANGYDFQFVVLVYDVTTGELLDKKTISDSLTHKGIGSPGYLISNLQDDTSAYQNGEEGVEFSFSAQALGVSGDTLTFNLYVVYADDGTYVKAAPGTPNQFKTTSGYVAASYTEKIPSSFGSTSIAKWVQGDNQIRLFIPDSALPYSTFGYDWKVDIRIWRNDLDTEDYIYPGNESDPVIHAST